MEEPDAPSIQPARVLPFTTPVMTGVLLTMTEEQTCDYCEHCVKVDEIRWG